MIVSVDVLFLLLLYVFCIIIALVNYRLFTKYKEHSNEMAPILRFFIKHDKLVWGLISTLGFHVVAGSWLSAFGFVKYMYFITGCVFMNLVFDILTLLHLHRKYG